VTNIIDVYCIDTLTVKKNHNLQEYVKYFSTFVTLLYCPNETNK